MKKQREVSKFNAKATLCQDGKKRWIEVPAHRFDCEGELLDLSDLLAKCAPFVDGEWEMEDVDL